MPRKAKKTPVSPSPTRLEREREAAHPPLRDRRHQEVLSFRDESDAPPHFCPHCRGKDIGEDSVIIDAKRFCFQVEYRYCVPCNAVLFRLRIRSIMAKDDDHARVAPSPIWTV